MSSSHTATTRTPTPRTGTATRSRRQGRSTPRPTLAPGTKVGAYELLEVVGRGGMGIVYKAYHPPLDRTVAVKVLKVLEHDPEAARRFAREAQTSALLRHPNILSVFDYGEVDGAPYMVTEYLPGGTLSDLLRADRKPDVTETMTILRAIAAALDFAHGHQVVHRDVKPGNILIDEHGSAVLGDFGLAKVVHESTTHTTGMPTGTPAYVAPEQISDGSVGPAADRYSFTVMAFQLLTGQLPFEARDFMKTLYAHVQETPRRATDVAPGLPTAVDAILARGLAKDPRHRWDTCGEIVDALELALVAEWPADTRPTVALSPLPVPAAQRAVIDDVATQVLVAPATNAATVDEAEPETYNENARRRRALGWAFTAGAFAVGFLLFLGLAALLRPGQQGVPALNVPVKVALPGQSIQVSATHLPPHQKFELYLTGTNQPIGMATTDANGAFTAQPILPGNASPGTHTLKLCSNSQCPLMTDVTLMSVPPPAGLRSTPRPTPRQPAKSPTHATPASTGATYVPPTYYQPASQPSVSGAPAPAPQHPGKSGQCHGNKCH